MRKAAGSIIVLCCTRHTGSSFADRARRARSAPLPRLPMGSVRWHAAQRAEARWLKRGAWEARILAALWDEVTEEEEEEEEEVVVDAAARRATPCTASIAAVATARRAAADVEEGPAASAEREC